MGNSISSVIGNSRFSKSSNNSPTSTTTRPATRTKCCQQHQQNFSQQQQFVQQQNERKSKTLPSRRQRKSGTERVNVARANNGTTTAPPSGETSRMLFLLYLIHRTWNVVVDTMDSKSKKSRHSVASVDSGAPPTNSLFEDSNSCCGGGNLSNVTINDDLDVGDHGFLANKSMASSFCGSLYSYCSCSDCYDVGHNNVYSSMGDNRSIANSMASIFDRQTISQYESDIPDFCDGYQMAPSICRNSPTLTPANKASSGTAAAATLQKSHFGSNSLDGSLTSYKMTNSENSWPQSVFSKENQRPPVYNPEDYALKLKKFGKRQNGPNVKSIYDTTDAAPEEPPLQQRSSTLPSKHTAYKSPIPTPPESDSEMSLRQFASVTDLLTKLRADLRVSFPSFVQEFVGTPMDGVSALLEVLRALQLSQNMKSPTPAPTQAGTMPRNAQYQRRALMDELACLQCLSICCSRSLEATARLGTTPVGLISLAVSATGQGIRARILALQLMTAACDKQMLGHGSHKNINAGHTAVSEAMSTLRLRCSEPVRFRLLVGMLNSGGGSGELQAVGVKFINTFLESAENLQQRLYLQAELYQAGFEPTILVKTISSSSPWLDSLRNEIKRFQELKIDVDKMLTQARDADRVRSQMVILERRVQILHEEKAVLTSMERRLQERCAELQREIFRLQGAHNQNNFKSLDKQQPVALPRHVPPTHSKQDSSEHEDEGISSSETGPSLSPVPILVLPQKSNTSSKLLPTQKYKHKRSSTAVASNNQEKSGDPEANVGDAEDATIEDVMEELDNIVNEAERQISSTQQHPEGGGHTCAAQEQKIVPVNIVPQPPRKSRSLAHLLSQGDGSDLDGSEYGMLLMHNQADQAVERVTALQTFFDETDCDAMERDKSYAINVSDDIPEVAANAAYNQPSTTRQLLDVIMNARHSEDDPTIKAFREGAAAMPPANAPAAAAASNNHQHPQHQQHFKRNSFVASAAEANAVASKKPPAPAQQFNGVFFMTGMNTAQKYPKPDVSAALHARRVTKNVERLEAAFASHETLNEIATTNAVERREKSRCNQQIYFGSNPTLRLNAGYDSYTNNVTVINNAKTRTRSYTQGSKVTDLPSGLY